jgi:hypothetical protein
MLVHNDRIALGGVRGDKFIFGAIRGDKQLFDTSVITDANKEYILATYGEEALAKALVYLHGNPSFIPFFNEDPDTICSVCEIGYVRYIKRTYFDTGFTPTRHTEVEVVVRTINETNGNHEVIFGAGKKDTPQAFGLGGTAYGAAPLYDFYKTFQYGFWDFKKTYRIKFNINQFSIDDKVWITGTSTDVDNLKTQMFIQGNEEMTNMTGNCFLVENKIIIKDNGIKVRHMIPYKKADGTLCMFDMVHFALYPQLGIAGVMVVMKEGEYE